MSKTWTQHMRRISLCSPSKYRALQCNAIAQRRWHEGRIDSYMIPRSPQHQYSQGARAAFDAKDLDLARMSHIKMRLTLMGYFIAQCYSQGTKAYREYTRYHVCICSLVSPTHGEYAHSFRCQRLGQSACAAHYCVATVNIMLYSAVQ